MKSFRLQPSLLRSCAPAMSTEETRYYLKGVHVFEKSGSLIYEATNGHMLIRVTASLEQEEDVAGLNVIIPDFFVKEIVKTSFLKGFGVIGLEYVDAVIDGQTIILEMPEGTASNKLVDGTFPDCDNVMPKHTKGLNAIEDISFNLEYMARLAKSAKCFGDYTAHMAIQDASGVSYFEKTGERGLWQAALMPVRC